MRVKVMKVMFFHDPEDIFAEAGLRNCTKFAGGWVEKDIFQNQFDDKSWCTRINILVFLHPLKEHTTNGWKNHATSMCLCIDRWKFHSYVFVRPWKKWFLQGFGTLMLRHSTANSMSIVPHQAPRTWKKVHCFYNVLNGDRPLKMVENLKTWFQPLIVEPPKENQCAVFWRFFEKPTAD